MKKISTLIALALCWTIPVPRHAHAQSNEVVQLLLNVEKLSQLQSILTDMKRGYEILNGGYNAIKNISEGNFNLHHLFLDGLMAVNPEIAKYRRVPDIIRHQKDIVSEYRAAFNQFRESGNFTEAELEYFGRVYRQLFDRSIANLDELIMVTTASQLRMSDDERLRAIDRIFYDMEDKLSFLRYFNREGSILAILREREKKETNTLKQLYGTEHEK